MFLFLTVAACVFLLTTTLTEKAYLFSKKFMAFYADDDVPCFLLYGFLWPVVIYCILTILIKERG